MKKFKLTTETKIFFGQKLFRIQALIDVCEGVKSGDLGGWVEKEENLSQVFDKAWVSGEARVFGEAWVSPIFISGLRWNITIAGENMAIGCEKHAISDWNRYKKLRIKKMGDGAWEWWQLHKPLLMPIAEAHRSQHLALAGKEQHFVGETQFNSVSFDGDTSIFSVKCSDGRECEGKIEGDKVHIKLKEQPK